MQDEVNTKVVAIMIKGGKISAEVLKKALDKFVQEIEKAQKQILKYFMFVACILWRRTAAGAVTNGRRAV